jgi:hypothetical protein
VEHYTKSTQHTLSGPSSKHYRILTLLDLGDPMGTCDDPYVQRVKTTLSKKTWKNLPTAHSILSLVPPPSMHYRLLTLLDLGDPMGTGDDPYVQRVKTPLYNKTWKHLPTAHSILFLVPPPSTISS